jgi:hypothetical protein
MHKKFVSAYQGSSHYLVNHVMYTVRTFALPRGSHCPNQWPFVLSEVGTVRAYDWPAAAEFPPAEVLALFPGHVGARVNADKGYVLEHDGTAPSVVHNTRCDWYEVA